MNMSAGWNSLQGHSFGTWASRNVRCRLDLPQSLTLEPMVSPRLIVMASDCSKVQQYKKIGLLRVCLFTVEPLNTTSNIGVNVHSTAGDDVDLGRHELTMTSDKHLW